MLCIVLGNSEIMMRGMCHDSTLRRGSSRCKMSSVCHFDSWKKQACGTRMEVFNGNNVKADDHNTI